MRRLVLGLALLVALGLFLLWRLAMRDTESAPAGVERPAHAGGPRVAPVPALPEPVMAATPQLPVVTATNTPVANAADKYRKAFALLDALSADEKKALADWKAEVDPAVAAELCAKLKPICELAHQAAALTNCDWGIKQITFETALPHLSQARNLARGLVWNVAHCRADDVPGTGVDLEATLRLGNNVSQFLIGHLVNTAIEKMAMEFIAASAGTLPRESAARLAALLSDDTYAESLYRALETEAEMVRNFADKFARMTAQERQQFEEQQQLMGEKALIPPGMDVKAALQQVVDLEHEYVRALGTTDAEYRTFLAKLEAAKETNPFVKLLCPALERVEDTTRATIVQRAMTVAGLALMQEGPGVLTRHLDPATGQPFIYRPTATGFELQSAYQRDNKPVVMTFLRNK